MKDKITRSIIEKRIERLNTIRSEDKIPGDIVLEHWQPGDSRHTYKLMVSTDGYRHDEIFGLRYRMTAQEAYTAVNAMLAVYLEDDRGETPCFPTLQPRMDPSSIRHDNPKRFGQIRWKDGG